MKTKSHTFIVTIPAGARNKHPLYVAQILRDAVRLWVSYNGTVKCAPKKSAA